MTKSYYRSFLFKKIDDVVLQLHFGIMLHENFVMIS